MNKILIITLLFLCLACENEAPRDTQTTEAPSATQLDTTAKDPEVLVADTLPFPDTVEYAYTDGAVELTWEIMAMVDFEETFNEELQAYIPYPDFHPPVEALEGKEVIVRGFVIPLEETGDETILVLSANPFSSCFFCGGAGPETVMDIKLKSSKGQHFKTDQRMAFRGKLKLNDSDLYYLNYILEEAEAVR